MDVYKLIFQSLLGTGFFPMLSWGSAAGGRLPLLAPVVASIRDRQSFQERSTHIKSSCIVFNPPKKHCSATWV